MLLLKSLQLHLMPSSAPLMKTITKYVSHFSRKYKLLEFQKHYIFYLTKFHLITNCCLTWQPFWEHRPDHCYCSRLSSPAAAAPLHCHPWTSPSPNCHWTCSSHSSSSQTKWCQKRQVKFWVPSYCTVVLLCSYTVFGVSTVGVFSSARKKKGWVIWLLMHIINIFFKGLFNGLNWNWADFKSSLNSTPHGTDTANPLPPYSFIMCCLPFCRTQNQMDLWEAYLHHLKSL